VGVVLKPEGLLLQAFPATLIIAQKIAGANDGNGPISVRYPSRFGDHRTVFAVATEGPAFRACVKKSFALISESHLVYLNAVSSFECA
jgi:hypothetical protein